MAPGICAAKIKLLSLLLVLRSSARLSELGFEAIIGFTLCLINSDPVAGPIAYIFFKKKFLIYFLVQVACQI